ncbi:MAG: anti-sigma factor antagonist [Firmicutes bacterium]|nr:anti-sigma factor antagonist [Bacillota bacterium]
MQAELDRTPQALVVRLIGELDHFSVQGMGPKIDRQLSRIKPPNLVLNLKGLTFLDSSGVGLILGRYRQVRAKGGTVAACHLGPQVRKVFDIAGLSDLLLLCRSESEALSRL